MAGFNALRGLSEAQLSEAAGGLTLEEIGQALQNSKEGATSNVVTQNLAVREWVSRDSAADNEWSDIAYSDELGLFVAVANTGSNNQVMTSKNGRDWTTRTPAADRGWQNVAWSPELGIFVAISNFYSNTSMTSTDGVNWIAANGGVVAPFNDLIWVSELSKFFALGNGEIVYSSDGKNWTRVATGFSHNIGGISYGEGRLVIAASSGSNENIIYSEDAGLTWSLGTGFASIIYSSIDYSESLGLFVAVAINQAANCIQTSSDGIVWTNTGGKPTGISFRDVKWSPELGLFCIVADGGGSSTNARVLTSPDGENWDIRYSPIDNSWQRVTWAKRLGMFCAVSDDGTGDRVMTSR